MILSLCFFIEFKNVFCTPVIVLNYDRGATFMQSFLFSCSDSIAKNGNVAIVIVDAEFFRFLLRFVCKNVFM